MSIFNSKVIIVILAGIFVCSPFAIAQESMQRGVVTAESDIFASFRIAPTSVLSEAVAPLLEIARREEARDLQGHVVEEVLDFNLGMQIMPVENLNIQVEAWQQELNERPGYSNQTGSIGNLPQLYIENSTINEFNVDDPALGSNIESQGFDIGASYVWDTSRFGQFTLSAKTTYVKSFDNRGSILDFFGDDSIGGSDRLVSPELQSNLMLTWEFGNHTASAITNYFDSFKDINDIDIDEIHALVDNIATVDFQYGYSVETGGDDRAIISFGIRNIFNERTARILNSNTRILDQNGRVAYGSIKYQF